MRIIDKYNCVNEIVDTIHQKAKYQKVVICLDETSDIKFIDNICCKLNRSVVLIKYYYHTGDNDMFFNIINNGARVVVYNVSLLHFYKLQNNNNYLLNIFIPQSKFVLPYMDTIESVYGDNIIVCDTSGRDYIGAILLYEMALNNLWGQLVQGIKTDIEPFKRIDRMLNNGKNFYMDMLEIFYNIRYVLADDYKSVEESQLPFYIYLQLCAILKMLESVKDGKEQYIDFYKKYKSREEVDKAYKLIVDCNIIETIKSNNNNLIKICEVILNRLKIIIKRKFNFKRIKFNKINNIIKSQSKMLNIDNLLYISHIFNSI